MKYEITGTMKVSRNKFTNFLNSIDGWEHVSKANMEVLLVGDKPGDAKVMYAVKKGVKIMYEAELYKLVGEIPTYKKFSDWYAKMLKENGNDYVDIEEHWSIEKSDAKVWADCHYILEEDWMKVFWLFQENKDKFDLHYITYGPSGDDYMFIFDIKGEDND